jgi:hypothetical protein
MGRPPASITIETDDCRKTVEELQSRGVEFVSDVLELPWGYVAQFQDPTATGYRYERAANHHARNGPSAPIATRSGSDQARRVSLPTSSSTERSRSFRVACSTDLMPSLRFTQALISR